MVWVGGGTFVVRAGSLAIDVAAIDSKLVAVVRRDYGLHSLGGELCKHAI